MRYSAVLFDVGETLIGPREPYGVVYARAFGELGWKLAADRFEAAIRWTIESMGRRIPTGTDRFSFFPGGEEEYWRRFATASAERAGGRAVQPELVEGALRVLREFFATPAAWRVYPDAVPALEALRSDGLRLGVVSNWDSRLPRVLRLLGLADYFDAVGVSHLEGMEKPTPEFFHRVLERLGARPENALHVGDLPGMDLEGARRAGIDGLLVDRHGRLDGTHTALTDLGDLAERIRNSKT